jgi:hypothetical protein
MKGFLHLMFFQNWPRKAISAGLAVFIWFAVNHSLTSTRTISGIPVRMVNVPSGKTIEGLQNNGHLSKKITLSLVGNKSLLDDLSANDLEVVIDASEKSEEWIATVNKKNLVSINPDIDLSSGISRISHQSFIIRMMKLVTEKIPVIITKPIGEPPRDYQFLDIWPYQLDLTVAGPEETIKQLKAKGVKLTFNLHQITKSHLDDLSSAEKSGQKDVVSYFVPDQWKQIPLPILSEAPLEINDPQAKALRIDFVRANLLALEKPLPVTFFIPSQYAGKINCETLSFAPTDLLKKIDGTYFLTPRLFAKGVSDQFLKIVKDMLQLVVILTPNQENNTMEWCLQFMNPSLLEDRYVSLLLSDSMDDEIRELQPSLREEYLRNRFRNYMNHFQLYLSDENKFDLQIELNKNSIEICPKKSLF